MTTYDDYRYAIKRRTDAQERFRIATEQLRAIRKEQRRLKQEYDMFSLLEKLALEKLPENQCTN